MNFKNLKFLMISSHKNNKNNLIILINKIEEKSHK